MKTRQPEKIPVYIQVKNELHNKIIRQEWQEGDCLPSERELCEKFGTSRMTIRQAISELVREGVVNPIQGKGTFVAKEKIRQPLLQLTSFSEDMRARGMQPASQTLALDIIPATAFIAQQLSLKTADDIIILRRLRLADNEPMAIETSYLSYARCAAIYEDLTNNQSLYGLIRNKLNIGFSRAVQCIEVGKTEGWEAALLQIEKNASILKIQRQTFDENNLPVEYVVSQYRADRYQFYTELKKN